MQADSLHTDMLIAILCYPHGGEVKIKLKVKSCKRHCNSL